MKKNLVVNNKDNAILGDFSSKKKAKDFGDNWLDEQSDSGNKDAEVRYMSYDGWLEEDKLFYPSKYAEGGGVGDVSGNYFSSTDFVESNNLMELAKKTFGADWESGGDFDFDTEEVKALVKKLGGGYKVEYVDSDRQNRDNFEAAKQKYFPKMAYHSNDGDIFVVRTKDVSDYAGGGEIKTKNDIKNIFGKSVTDIDISEGGNFIIQGDLDEIKSKADKVNIPLEEVESWGYRIYKFAKGGSLKGWFKGGLSFLNW